MDKPVDLEHLNAMHAASRRSGFAVSEMAEFTRVYPAIAAELSAARERIAELEEQRQLFLNNWTASAAEVQELRSPARDARMRREGAAAWLESYIAGEIICAHKVVALFREEAARLRGTK